MRDVAGEYRWAHESGAQGMPTPDELEAQGWVRVHFHPNYRRSWLMRKDDALL